MKLTRKDFLKLLGAAPLVPLAKYLKPETLEEAMMRSEPALRELAEAATNVDMTMFATGCGFGVEVGDIVNISETETGFNATYKIKSIDGDGNWEAVIMSADEA